MINRFFTSFIITLISISAISQEKEIFFDELDPSAPSKAAFYSAVLPGLGQGYNKKYWKIPIVYAAIGTSIYSYDFNQKKYWDYRNAYKSRKAGYKNDPYQDLIIDDFVSNIKYLYFFKKIFLLTFDCITIILFLTKLYLLYSNILFILFAKILIDSSILI